MPQTPPWTREQAAEAGRRSAQAKKRRAAERRANPLMVVEEALPDLLQDLLRAAKGQAPYQDLPADKRLQALFRAIEYGTGKPPPAAKPKDQPEATEPVEAEGVTIL